MSQTHPTPVISTLLTFLVGAAIGAIVVALRTPTTGPRIRRDLKRRDKARARRALAAFQGAGTRTNRHFVWHVGGAKQGTQVSLDDLPG